MALNFLLESKGITQIAANAARQMRLSSGNLFFQSLKNGFFGLSTAANAALAASFLLNVRKGFFLSVFLREEGFTPPILPHLPHPRFSYATLHPTRP